MNFARNYLAFPAALVAAIFLSSCGTSNASSGPEGRPTKLRYAFSSNQEDPEQTAKRVDLVTKYLRKALHMEVEVLKTSDSYGAVIEAFRANKIDVASISPFSYIIATQTIPIEAIVIRGTREGEPGDYTGVLVVPGDSPIKSIEDVKRHAKELTVSFVDPASASGFLVQRAYLQSIGIEPERDFKRVAFSMNHLASIMTIKSHKVDIAATAERMVKRYIDTGKLAPKDVRVIWVSPEIPNQPTAVRKSLPAGFKEEIRKALLEMPDRDPEAFKNLYPRYFPMPEGSIYVPANDAKFDGLRKMARGVKNLSLLEK